MSPMFSFVIPVYNAEKFLPRCLESVFAQTCQDFEVVVVDDCSEGNCKEIVEKFGRRFRDIRYVRHAKNRSLLQARITGAVHASGKYIVPLDADDYVQPHLIEKLKEAVGDGERAIIVYQMAIDRDGEITPAWHNHIQSTMPAKDFFDEMLASKVLWNMCGKSFHRKYYLEAIMWAHIGDDVYINVSEDLCQMIPLLLMGGEVKFIEYSGYRYWSNPKSLTKNISSIRGMNSRIRSLKPRAQQCQTCIDILVAACVRHKHQHSEIVKIKKLLEPIVKWCVEDLRDLPPRPWSDCINILCAVHNPELVLRLTSQLYPDMVKRYAPTRDIIPSQEGGLSIRTIGIICGRSSGGGAERATALWAQEMSTRGYTIVWFCDDFFTSQMGDVAKSNKFSVVPLSTTDLQSRWNVLKENAIKYQIGLFLLVDHWRDLVIRDLLLVKSLGRRAVIAEHNVYFFPLDDLNFSLYEQRAKFYPLADVVTVLSPENVAWWHATGLQSVVYMPNLLTFDFKTSMLLNPPKRPTGSFLCVGRICERKQQDNVIEAFARYRESEQEPRTSRLTLLGRFNDSQIEQKIRTQIEQLGLSKVVSIPGEVADVDPYYRRADILLVASRMEGAPMVINEAKAKGLPVIMFDLPYVEGTRPGNGVVTVPMNDIESMAREMKNCITDKEKYKKLSQEGRSSLKKYETGTVMKRWEKLLRVVESHTTTPMRLDPMCEAVPAERMLPMTMNAIGALVPVFQSWWVKNINAVWCASQHEKKIGEDRDKAYAQVKEAWKAHDAIAADCEKACDEWRFWESEFQRLWDSRSFKIGRAVTWPLRMVRNSFFVLRDEGFVSFCRRVPRKIINLKRRFLG